MGSESSSYTDSDTFETSTRGSKMEQEGLIEREVVVPERGPARKLLHITSKGKSLFQDWLRSEQYESGGVLYDFMQGYPFFTKCSFLQHLEPDEARKERRMRFTTRR